MAAEKKPQAGAKPKKKAVSQSKYYTVSDDRAERKNKTCPKCGPGVFLAEHKERTTCGQCHYTEFKKK